MISVIIPTYKRAKYIDRAIKSILSQKKVEVEIIIVDDNDQNSDSRKDMLQKMKKYKKYDNILYIKHQKNMNGAVARNTGISYAKGDYISFLDDDDYYLPDRLFKLQTILDKNKDFDFAYSNVIVINNNKITKVINKPVPKQPITDLLQQKSFFSTGSNLFFRKKALEDIGGFDETFLRNQDLEVMVRFLRNHKMIKVDEFLVVKDESDKINIPEPLKIHNIKCHFLKSFEKDIPNGMEKEIKLANIYSTLSYAILTKNDKKDVHKLLIEEANKIGGFSTKQKIKLKIYSINKFINIIDLITKFRMQKKIKALDKNFKKIIQKWGEYNEEQQK